MDTKDLLKMELEMSSSMTLKLLEDMNDAPLTAPTPNGGNHPLWIAGHLAYSIGSLINNMMLGEDNPLAEWKELFDGGTQPVADAAHYPPYDELIAKCQEMHASCMATLESLSESDLDSKSKNCPEEYAPFFGTYRQCFLITAMHWMMHRGQVADARKAAGREVLEM